MERTFAVDPIDPIDFMNAYDLVTIGMRVAYMDTQGYLDLPVGISGEEELTSFAMQLSKDWSEVSGEGMVNWDEYIEERILSTYGKYKST